MIRLHIKKDKIIHDLFRTQIAKQQKSALNSLKKINKKIFSIDEQTYLDEVIRLFSTKDFLLRQPSEIDSIISATSDLPDNSQKKPLKPLKKHILDALKYKSLRDNFYPGYFQKIGIKACVYCNSQLTVSIHKKGGGYSAKFDVDHFYPKDDYPYLSISLFNLYPSCTSCNRIKKENLIDFMLYEVDPKNLIKSQYSFKLDSASKAKYLLTKDFNDLKFVFSAPLPKANYKATRELFHIEEIYRTQLDVVEDLIIKSQIYTDSYKKILRSNFTKLNLNSKLFERVLVGNYTEDKELHKRPMAKFTQDIAKQLGLVNRDNSS